MGYNIVRRRIISTTPVAQLVYRCPKRSFILPPPNIMLQFYKCYRKNYCATGILLEKLFHMKSNINSGTKPGTDLLQSAGSKTLFYPISIMFKLFIEDSGNLKRKTINNTTVSLLVSCCVIPRSATMKGWEKEVFWKIVLLEI